MSVNISFVDNLSDKEKYELLLTQIKSLLNADEPIISNLANVAAALKQTFSKISWVGFYILHYDKLYLGPFQGNTACTAIEMGKGVCGTAAEKLETLIVKDVHAFPGHIACDAGSNSEIVVPIKTKKKIWGVLDLDSYQLCAFDENDKLYLEKIIAIIADSLILSKFIMN
ncbi:MAG: GAF domain-containing protein [bacterium]